MKTKNIIYSLIVILVTLSSCREITVKTSVNKDGSFVRTITISGDSSDVLNSDLPYPVDTSWKKEFVKDTNTTEKGKYILTYTKAFSNSKLLMEEIDRDESWVKSLNRKIDIKKSYGIFFSYITFSEFYPTANPFKDHDYKKYLSPEDITRLNSNYLAMNSIDSLKVEESEEKQENYFIDAIATEIIEELMNGCRKLENPLIDPQDILLHSDSIKSRLAYWSFNDPLEFIDSLILWTGNPEFSKLYDLDPPLFVELSYKLDHFEKILEFPDYEQYVEMPGIITETNSSSIEGNTVSWNVDIDQILIEDYTMTVESRVINKWSIILFGVILLALLVFLVIRVKK